MTVAHHDPCEQCLFKFRRSSENSGFSEPPERNAQELPKFAKIELNSFLMRKLRERLAAEKKDQPEVNLVRNLGQLKERFDKIVGHISDFSFVADTI